MYGLSDALLEQIKTLAKRFGITRLVLFGSHARSDFRANGDTDLAAYGLHPRDEMPFLSTLEDLPTLLKCDMIAIRKDTDPSLLREIEKDGVTLMERLKHKQQFVQALRRLKEAVEESNANPSTVVRDGVIQRFEFTTGLAWKACREKLLEDGYVNIDSPKSTMRQAYAASLIDDEITWPSLLQARNLSLHMYSEEQLEQIFEQIIQTYLPLFEKFNTAL